MIILLKKETTAMVKNRDIVSRIILLVMITLGFTFLGHAQSKEIKGVLLGCCKCLTDCANNAISLASESVVMDGERYSDYPECYDPYDPISMGEVDPWEVYREMQEEEMDRAMAEEAQRAWQDYNEPQPDISDRIIKP